MPGRADVQMRDPQGNVYPVVPEDVALAESKGWTRVSDPGSSPGEMRRALASFVPGVMSAGLGSLGLAAGPAAPYAVPALSGIGMVAGQNLENLMLGEPPPTVREQVVGGAMGAATGGLSSLLRASSMAARPLYSQSLRPTAGHLARNPQLVEEAMGRGLNVGGSGAAAKVEPLQQAAKAERATAKGAVLEGITDRARDLRRSATAESKSRIAAAPTGAKVTIDELAEKAYQRAAGGGQLSARRKADVKARLKTALQKLWSDATHGGRLPNNLDRNQLDTVRKLARRQIASIKDQSKRGQYNPDQPMMQDIEDMARELMHARVPGLAESRAVESEAMGFLRAAGGGNERAIARMAGAGNLEAQQAMRQLAAIPQGPAGRELPIWQALASAEARPMPASILAALGTRGANLLNNPWYGRIAPQIPYGVQVPADWWLIPDEGP